MRFFIDSSSLFKKYVDEAGSDRLPDLLEDAAEIAVSPVTRIEIIATVERGLRSKIISASTHQQILEELNTDFDYFLKIVWNEELEKATENLLRKYTLRSLDAIQLASAELSECASFITSDKQLYSIAKKLLDHAQLL